MVVIQIKTSDSDSFLFETTCDTSNDSLLRDIVDVWNIRIRLSQLTGSIRELAKYGPMKPMDKVGLDVIQEEDGVSIHKAEYYNADPTGMRTGNGPGPQLSDTIEKVALDAESLLSKVPGCKVLNYFTNDNAHIRKLLIRNDVNVQDTVARKIPISMHQLQERLDNIRGAVMMCK